MQYLFIYSSLRGVTTPITFTCNVDVYDKKYEGFYVMRLAYSNYYFPMYKGDCIAKGNDQKVYSLSPFPVGHKKTEAEALDVINKYIAQQRHGQQYY